MEGLPMGGFGMIIFKVSLKITICQMTFLSLITLKVGLRSPAKI
jgi:hypothetical protein